MPQVLNIRHTDRAWHAAFLRYVPRVFAGVSFEGWYEYVGWDEAYQTFSIVADTEIVASISVQRMQLVIDGRAVRGWQLGAVGTVPTHRGRGLHRKLMPHVLALASDQDCMFLFANDTVLDFYPRFGFSPAREAIFGVAHSVTPSGTRARRVLVSDARDRMQVAALAARAHPVTETFGARDYGRILLWYWTNFYAENFFWIDEEDALIVADEKDGVLTVLDVVTDHAFDLPARLSQIVTGPVTRIEFGFTPEKWWPAAQPVREYQDSPLFVRGYAPLPTPLCKFPLLAQT